MTIADLIKSLIDTSKDRIKTPITGAFIWSFSVFNWRPLAILFFSNVSIEERIEEINNSYCNILAILAPILMAFAYTMGTPRVMVWIDSKMTKTKHDRLKKIYKTKEDIVILKTSLAIKILELKDAESGNKEKQDFLDQIESLKESNEQMVDSYKASIESYKNTITQLNSSLEKVNKMNSFLLDNQESKTSDINFNENIRKNNPNNASGLNKEFRNGILSTFSNQEINEIKLIKLGLDRKLKTSDISNVIIKKLKKNGIFRDMKGDLVLTSFGRDFFYFIKNKY